MSPSFLAFPTTYRVSDTPPLLVTHSTNRGCIPNLSKRKPWRYHHSDGDTDSPSDSDGKYATSVNCPGCFAPLLSLSLISRIDELPPYESPHHHHHHDDGENDDDGENTDEYNPDPWMELTSETWTDPEAEPQTEWQSASTPADSDSPPSPTDSYYSRGTPTSPPASDSAPVAGPSVASSTNSNSANRPSSSRGSNSAPSPSPSPRTTSAKPTSTLGTTRSATPTANKTSSTSTTSYDMIRPNTSSSLHIVAVITITPESSPNDPNTTNTINGGVIDPYPTPARNPYNSGTDSDQSRNANGVVSSQNVPLAVIVGSVFGIVFGGLALFCVLFGINKLRQRKQDSMREQRSRRLRMSGGTGSSSTIMLARGPEASGYSQTGPGSIHTNEHGDGGILVRETSDSPTGSGRGWIRFANQRRPSSVPVLPEVKDHSNTPLMQEWNSPSSVHPPKPQFMERDHSPTVPSPLRTNRVTGRDSPSGWI